MKKIIKTWQERKAADPAFPPPLTAGDDSYYRNCETMELRAYVEELESRLAAPEKISYTMAEAVALAYQRGVDSVTHAAPVVAEGWALKRKDGSGYGGYMFRSVEQAENHNKTNAMGHLYKVVGVSEVAAHPVAPALVAEGWRIVPIEPTDEMRQACLTLNDHNEIDAEWAAMLAAAPAHPVAGSPAEAQQWKVCDTCLGRGERDIAHGKVATCPNCMGKGTVHTTAAAEPMPASEAVPIEVQSFAIEVEKMLCKALGRPWTAAGISIESLIEELARPRTAAHSSEAESEQEFVKLFESVINQDPSAYGREGETVYQVTLTELHAIARKLAAPAAPTDTIPALRNAFITLESSGGEGRTIVLKFNQREDAYAVHDFLLKGGQAAPTDAIPERIIEIAAGIFGFKPHKMDEEHKAKYLRFASEVAAAQSVRDTERYLKLRDWYFRGGQRSEIDPHGHVRVATNETFDAGVDALQSPSVRDTDKPTPTTGEEK